MSKNARMIMYPLLAVVLGVAVYAGFFYEKGEEAPIGNQPTEQVENVQVQTAE